jgi:hypothetical protein
MDWVMIGFILRLVIVGIFVYFVLYCIVQGMNENESTLVK